MSKTRRTKAESKQIIYDYLIQFTYWKSITTIVEEAFHNDCSQDTIRKYLKQMSDDGILERRLFNRQANDIGKSGIIYGYRVKR